MNYAKGTVLLNGLAVVLAGATCFAQTGKDQAADELALIAGRLREDRLGQANKNEAARADQLSVSLLPDGTWPDIDYADQTGSDGWKANQHMLRLVAMTRVYARSPSPKLHDAIMSAYDHWTTKDYRNPNWWHNEIGVPMHLGDVMLFLGSELTGERRAKGLAIVKRARVGMTGQNLLWKAGIQCVWACLDHDAPHLKKALNAIANEIRVTTGEGVQQDFSFHQHGRVLYNGGYGALFARDAARWFWLADGTRFAFSPEKRAVMLNYLLDGQRWMVRGQTYDYSATGREISRKGHNCRSLAAACAYALRLQNLSVSQRTALAETKARIEAGSAGDTVPPLSGNRNFWCSDYMTHHRPGWMMSIHMVSKRLKNTDMPCNDEGLRNQAIADGAAFIYRRGDEYRDIFGAWDWLRVPGTTEVDDPALFSTPVRFTGPTTFVGGVSDGCYGAAVMDYQRDKGRLAAHKAWFLFNDEVVCLGSALKSAAARPAITTINQCLLTGPVLADGKVVPEGSRRLDRAGWVLHDGIGYVLSGSGPVQLVNQDQEGSWWNINHDYAKKPDKLKVFSFWFDHGVKPAEGAAYSYTVVPGVDAVRLAAYAAAPPVTVLANAEHLQAVWHQKLRLLMAAFWKPGSVRADADLELSVDQPCLAMVQRTAQGLHVTVADPEHRPVSVRLSVSGQWSGAGCAWKAQKGVTEWTMTLPGGDAAGSSVVMDLAVP